jgi:predicted 2-oxoglutarate/Fe(II)-dependent dioxygenase YbiX
MPPAAFFTRFAFYIVERFLEAVECVRIHDEMRAARSTPATVRDHGDVYAVDEATRRTRVVGVSEPTEALVIDRLDRLRPALESHFGVRGTSWRLPQFLLYGPGDFFVAHKDRSDASDAGTIARGRVVSTIIFLNAPSEAPAGGAYGGGALTFYRLLTHPQLKDVGLPLAPEAGLLVAFPADVVHAVTAVTHGERSTIVTWLAE